MPQEKGFTHILTLLVLLLIITLIGYFILNSKPKPTTKQATWQFNGQSWEAAGTPPDCPDPLIFPSPVEVSLVSGILYPGQIRGGDYKPHGAFRFDNQSTNEVEVRAITDGYLLKAAKYDDGYDVQIQVFYVNDCGIMVMHDHILQLSPKLQNALKDVPVKQGDSRTTNLPKIKINKGDILATRVGYPNFPGGKMGKNIFVDFGLYDLRQTNTINYSPEFRSQHPNINEYGTHALCWLDHLDSKEAQTLKNLPPGGKEGKTSDYCK